MKILVSSCLIGMKCRFDGTDKNKHLIEAYPQHQFIPVCPEQMGGLSTPRESAEQRNGRVYTKSGVDVSAQFELGAQQAIELAEAFACDLAILKEKSPSCGHDRIYDGTFSGTLIAGDGALAQQCRAKGIRVIGESDILAVLGEPHEYSAN